MSKFQAMDICQKFLWKSDYRSDPMVVLQPDDFAARVEEVVSFWNQQFAAEQEELQLLLKLEQK